MWDCLLMLVHNFYLCDDSEYKLENGTFMYFHETKRNILLTKNCGELEAYGEQRAKNHNISESNLLCIVVAKIIGKYTSLIKKTNSSKRRCL